MPQNADRAVAALVGGDAARPSDDLLTFVEAWEGCRLTPYLDGAGFRTVGYGHKMQPTDPDVRLTQDEAIALLHTDILYTADGVARLIIMPLAQCKFDALCDFAFEMGLGALATSTLRKRVNGGYFTDAAAEFAKWNNVRKDGALVADPGVTKRRAADRAMFVDCVYSQRP